MEDPHSASLQAAMEAPVTASLGPMDRLLQRLHSFKATEYNLPVGVTEDKIQSLKEHLQRLCISLKHVLEAEEPSLMAKCGLKEVRELCYDTEDFFDDLMHTGASAGARRSSRRSIVSWIHRKLKRRPQTVIQFSELMARVEDANDRRESFLLGQRTTKPDFGQASVSHLPPQLFLDLLEGPTNKLVELLAFEDGEKQLKVVPIFGISGVGKTTVARAIYHWHGGKFQCRAFLRVSRNPDMRRLLTSMISQIKAPQPTAFSDAQGLIDIIIKHLKGKSYFIIIDDLWTASVWDIISRAFPYGDCCSRIITTTQVEDVALSCCGYQSDYIFKMGPLDDCVSRKLFFTTIFGFQGEGACPKVFEEVSDGIIRKCGGLLLSTINIASLLQSKPSVVMEQWENIRHSLPSTLKTNPTSEGMKEVLNLIFNNLPPHLKTCLLYLSMYPEGYTIKKDELVKQWIAEGFVSSVEAAGGYFDELVSRGLILPVHTNYNGEVLSCTVHHMILDLIRHKSMEENFIINLDYLQAILGLPDKVRRLSIQFGDAKSAKIPENIRLSQVRSLLFCGFFKYVPSIVEYGLLRVLVLHIWADEDKTSFDLTRIDELFRLRYLNIECNITIDLPDKIEGLKNLASLQVDARLSTIPSDIVQLRSLLHLCLPSEANLPDGVGRMTSLRTLGYFDLSSNSKYNVKNLGELTSLQDLHLTCSVSQPDHLQNNIECLGSILGRLSSLRCLTFVLAFTSHVNTMEDASGSSRCISSDAFSLVSPPPAFLQRLELLPCIHVCCSLPKWIGELRKLCTLKIAVKTLWIDDIDILKGLPNLTALSLYVQIVSAERIVFGKAEFSVLRYFKFRCSVPSLKFETDAMPNLQKLKLCFNAPTVDQHGPTPIIIEHLRGLKGISAKVWVAPVAGESFLMTTIRNHPKNPKINVKLVNWNFAGNVDRSMVTQEQGRRAPEVKDEILEENVDEYDRTQYEDYEENKNKQANSRTSMVVVNRTSTLLESSSCWPIPGMFSRSAKNECEILQLSNIKIFSYSDLRLATRNFGNNLGEGSFGSVYKGWVHENTLSACKPGTGIPVAVKKLNVASLKGHQEWLAEVNYLGQLCHPNIVKLIGYCLEDEYWLLVYEFMPRGSLYNHLYLSGSQSLSWNLRMKVALGAAKGLAYLHSEKANIIYRNFKTSTILLDTDYTSKLGNFGLAMDGPVGEEGHVSTTVMGTIGYIDPEYMVTGRISAKSDIYGFGVVLLEMLSGRRAFDHNRPQGELTLVEWARPYLSPERTIHRVMDTRLGGQYPTSEAQKIAALAHQCVSSDARMRPSMDEVVSVLERIQDSSDGDRKQAAEEVSKGADLNIRGYRAYAHQ